MLEFAPNNEMGVYQMTDENVAAGQDNSVKSKKCKSETIEVRSQRLLSKKKKSQRDIRKDTAVDVSAD